MYVELCATIVVKYNGYKFLLHVHVCHMPSWSFCFVFVCFSQQACGFEYTSKLQRMFQDMSLSKDMNDRFKQHTMTTEAALDGEWEGPQ